MRTTLLVGFLTAAIALPGVAQIVLIDEDFSYGGEAAINAGLVASTNPTWSDNDASTFEGFPAADVQAGRGFSSLYDPGGGSVTIPGGLEVNASLAARTFSATITNLSSGIDTNISNNATLTFFGGLRVDDGGVAPTIRIRNITDATEILTTTTITGLNSSGNPSPEYTAPYAEWVLKTYNVTFAASDIGDTIQVDWFGGGNLDYNGLLLVDIDFVATAIPEPSTFALIFGCIALGGVVLRRRMKAAA